ncbi:MAG: mechanosensitive ion channel family protein [Candidatus Bathyarchaeota archaeon]|nr:mechanosensitive ion channel family protein [Candidatus Bathyarchaeota archaeon]
MAAIIGSLKKLFVFLMFIVILAVCTVLVFGLFATGPINLPTFLKQLGDLIIVFVFGIAAIFLLARSKTLLTPHIGIQAATIIQFFLLAIAGVILSFVVLGIFGVPISTLLTSAGIISVTVGLIISTFVGGILSGALVFTTYQFKIGDDVMVNNMPGKVTDMSALVMRIRTDVGQITIPNSAIANGGVIVTAVRKPEPQQETRLHYTVGDRVITSYRNEEGIVKEVTAYHTIIQLDSGKEIEFLNTSVLSGTVAIAKIKTQ